MNNFLVIFQALTWLMLNDCIPLIAALSIKNFLNAKTDFCMSLLVNTLLAVN
jgi:hypothetical protein